MKLLYKANGETHIIITKKEDPCLLEVMSVFYRLMLSAGFSPESFFGEEDFDELDKEEL